MIFDSPKAKTLINTYSTASDLLIPDAVILCRAQEYSPEREYLEKCFEKASDKKRQDWLSRLLSKDDRQHIAAWFEIMLFGWLLEISNTEAIDEDGYPDFLLKHIQQEMMIEARAILISQEKRLKDRFVGGLFSELKKVKKPYLVEIHNFSIGSAFPTTAFISEINNWLESSPEKMYEYKDKYMNRIWLSAKFSGEFDHVVATYSPGAFSVISEPLKRPLKEKATKYQSIRHSNVPYVIAIFLEDFSLGAGEIIEAWLGRTKYIIDINTRKIIDQQSDLSGIHFWGKEIVHKTVSGTLVFKSRLNSDLGRRELNAWWIENPFALNPINLVDLPIQGRYVVVEKTNTNFKMAWQK